jgi:hypothetical protein
MKVLLGATVALGLLTNLASASSPPADPPPAAQVVASSWSWFVIRPIFLPPNPCRCG